MIFSFTFIIDDQKLGCFLENDRFSTAIKLTTQGGGGTYSSEHDRTVQAASSANDSTFAIRTSMPLDACTHHSDACTDYSSAPASITPTPAPVTRTRLCIHLSDACTHHTHACTDYSYACTNYSYAPASITPTPAPVTPTRLGIHLSDACTHHTDAFEDDASHFASWQCLLVHYIIYFIVTRPVSRRGSDNQNSGFSCLFKI
jgi:hypothetical protein